ncbi:MAG: hypothetical protein AB1545_01125 [Thermodesulfobacteriota bacterium]
MQQPGQGDFHYGSISHIPSILFPLTEQSVIEFERSCQAYLPRTWQSHRHLPVLLEQDHTFLLRSGKQGIGKVGRLNRQKYSLRPELPQSTLPAFSRSFYRISRPTGFPPP